MNHRLFTLAGLCLFFLLPVFGIDPDFRSLDGTWNYNPRKLLVSLEETAAAALSDSPQVLVDPKSQALPAPPGTMIPKTGPNPSILSNNIVVAYYGSPNSRRMGILGEQSIEETGKLLKAEAARWDAVNGDEGVIPAFQLIYATVWADANVGILSDATTKAYIDYAAANGMIVILDHQLGKYPVADCVKRMLPWLKYPNVHLAIDPEWSTVNPGKEIGSIDASDVNNAQELIQNYLKEIGQTERRLFVVHQFNYKMIRNRETVRNDFDLIDLIHNSDGFGSPNLKLDTYRYVAKAGNMPMKGFKLFLPKSWKSKGFDSPLMGPQEVLAIKPRPVFINYQ